MARVHIEGVLESVVYKSQVVDYRRSPTLFTQRHCWYFGCCWPTFWVVDRPELRWEYVERGTKRVRVENPVDVALLVDYLFESLAVDFFWRKDLIGRSLPSERDWQLVYRTQAHGKSLIDIPDSAASEVSRPSIGQPLPDLLTLGRQLSV